MDQIRVLIVDDHVVVRQGLTAMLSPRNGMLVVGEAGNGRDAIRLALELQPDVTIMDLLMPEMDGLEATINIKANHPNARILILTSADDQELMAAIMSAGASGYLLKDSGVDELLQAIRSVHSGHLILSPMVMQAIAARPKHDAPTLDALSPREIEVLQGIVAGLTNQAIAVQLGISATTVRSHVSSILAKLNVTNRTQAALYAQEHHLL